MTTPQEAATAENGHLVLPSGVPTPVAPQTPPATQPPPGWHIDPRTIAPQTGAKGLKRPVTLGGMLIALIVTAVVFAGASTAMVLTTSGPRGHQGKQGQIGPRGVQGVRGRQGKNGVDGAAGAPGAAGATGAPGATRACSNDITVPLPYC
jgi:hypothetical protein